MAAVDTDVAEHLMKKCVIQLLQGKTRILCTHRLEFVEQADTVVLMEEGTIVKTGRINLVNRNRIKGEDRLTGKVVG